MSEPIKVGDLVQVVRLNGCGCSSAQGSSLGFIFCVEAIVTYPRGSYCSTCERTLSKSPYIAARSERGYYGLDRLKRIPPLEELEREKLVEKLRELI